MKEETQQEELDREAKLREEFVIIFDKYSLEELYIIKETLEKEINLSEIARAEGYEYE